MLLISDESLHGGWESRPSVWVVSWHVATVMFVSRETRRVMTFQIQAIANFNNVQKTCHFSDDRLATAMSEHQLSAC